MIWIALGLCRVAHPALPFPSSGGFTSGGHSADWHFWVSVRLSPHFFTSLTFGFGTSPLSFFRPPSSASSGLVKLLEWITECGTLILFITVFDHRSERALVGYETPQKIESATNARTQRGGAGEKRRTPKISSDCQVQHQAEESIKTRVSS